MVFRVVWLGKGTHQTLLGPCGQVPGDVKPAVGSADELEALQLAWVTHDRWIMVFYHDPRSQLGRNPEEDFIVY